MPKNRKKLIGLLAGVTLFSGLLIMLFKFISRPQKIGSITSENNIQVLKTIDTIFLDELGLGNFTCTGLTFDIQNNTFWIADFGTEKNNSERKPRLLELNEEFTEVLEVIDLSNICDTNTNLQGITYDVKDDSIWLATGDDVFEVDKKGQTIQQISMQEYKKNQSNGIAWDSKSDSLWVLCYTKYLLHMNKSGSIKNRIKFNYEDQDQIWLDTDERRLYITAGADYHGENNFLIEYNLNTNEIDKLYRLEKSYAVEGVVIANDKIYVANDGKYHSDYFNRSYISVYEMKN